MAIQSRTNNTATERGGSSVAMLTSCLNVIVIVAPYNLETICTSDLCTLVSKECTPGLLSLSVYIVVLNCIQSDISITRNN